MFIELIDQLRCPADHPDSALVAAISTRRERFVERGALGCPVCMREHPVAGGIVTFDDNYPDRVPGISAVSPPAVTAAASESSDGPEAALRIGAYLQASEGTTVVLAGEWARQSGALSELLPLRIFALNPAGPVAESESIGVIISSRSIPLMSGAVAGVALDQLNATDSMLQSAVRVLAPGGRLVAPVTAALPSGVGELARDSELWVAERERPLVRLARA